MQTHIHICECIHIYVNVCVYLQVCESVSVRMYQGGCGHGGIGCIGVRVCAYMCGRDVCAPVCEEHGDITEIPSQKSS